MQAALAKFMGTEECIMYSYDMATINSVLPAFANAKDVIICDEVCSPYLGRTLCSLECSMPAIGFARLLVSLRLGITWCSSPAAQSSIYPWLLCSSSALLYTDAAPFSHGVLHVNGHMLGS